MSANLNNPSRTRVGLIGAGSIARGAHLPGFLANSDVQVVAVADPVEGRAAALANEASIELAFTNFRELLNREDIDAVSIATPPVAHAETTIAALEAGKHVFCEKPMAMNSVEAIAMEQAALKANRVLAIDFQTRFEWDTQEARRLVTCFQVTNRERANCFQPEVEVRGGVESSQLCLFQQHSQELRYVICCAFQDVVIGRHAT